MKINRGATIIFETGEYSDYTFLGPFMVVKAFDQAEIIEKFKGAKVEPNCFEDGPDPSEFVPWLSKEGYIQDIPNVHAWHIGSYGRFEAEPQTQSIRG